MRLLISVTHLLGTGHLSRALTLAHAFCEFGHQAHLMSGGMPVPAFDFTGVDLHQLKPVRSDGVKFTTLLDQRGTRIDADYLTARSEQIDRVLHQLQPDVVITELYPFGRRVLAHEFQNLLKTAKYLTKTPLILSSIRDILAPPSKPEKAKKTEDLIFQFYNGVLVHSDEAVTPLQTSWPVSGALRERLLYTGFVAPAAPIAHPDGVGTGEILVTAGGGGVGARLFEAAVQAAAIDRDRTWRILVGGADADNEIKRLGAMGRTQNIVLERTRPDFRQMLANAAGSVSMCGYNTAMDLLQTGTPGVLVPFDAGGEVEQTLRAESLAVSGQFAVVPSRNMNPEQLLKAVSTVVDWTGKQNGTFDGAVQTVRIVERMRAEMK